jgi:hypothetical protein
LGIYARGTVIPERYCLGLAPFPPRYQTALAADFFNKIVGNRTPDQAS